MSDVSSAFSDGHCVSVRAAMRSIASPTFYTLATFPSTNRQNLNGSSPSGAVIADAFGNLYGTTAFGGQYSNGTIFELSGGGAGTLVNFDGTNGDGAWPYAGLIAGTDGNFYGTTFAGGIGGNGTVYELSASTHVLTTTTTFNGTNGASPYGKLFADGNGNLYGSTYYGGTPGPLPGKGTIFKIAGGSLVTLANFTGPNGANPYGGVIVDQSGNVYGTTYAGGASGNGTVFEYSPITQVVTTLVTFNVSNGKKPYAGLIADAAGNLYGAASEGGTFGYGTIFKIAANSHIFSTLFSFNHANGANPESDLIVDASGDLFGTAFSGGLHDAGTVFELPVNSNSLITLHDFSVVDGQLPEAPLMADGAGNLYGTTMKGGDSGNGTVFAITSSGFVVAPEPMSFALMLPAGFLLMRKIQRGRS